MIGLGLGVWGNRPAAGGGGVPGTYVRVRFPSMQGASAATIRNVGTVAGRFSLMTAAALCNLAANGEVAITFPITVGAITMASSRGANVLPNGFDLGTGWNGYNSTITTTTEPVPAWATHETYAHRGDINAGNAYIYTSDGYTFAPSKVYRLWMSFKAVSADVDLGFGAYSNNSGGNVYNPYSPTFTITSTWAEQYFIFTSPNLLTYSNVALSTKDYPSTPVNSAFYMCNPWLEDITAGAPDIDYNAGWNMAAMDAKTMTFNNGTRTVRGNDPTGGSHNGLRSLKGASSGKVFWSIKVDANEYGDISMTDSTDGYYCHWNYDGTIYSSSGGVLGTIDSYVQGDILDVAADLDANLIWFRKNGGNWNGNASYDPATGTGGFALPRNGSNVCYAKAALLYFKGSMRTLNLGSVAFTYAAPSGYTSLYAA